MCLCVCNPRAQVALLKGAKWRLWLGFDKWPLNTKATFANFGDEVEFEVTGVKRPGWCEYMRAGESVCVCACALPQH